MFHWVWQSVRETIREMTMRSRFYQCHRLYLPHGAVAFWPEHIRIGHGFLISPACRLYCQDPENGSELVIGDQVSLNVGVHINADSGGRIHIGDNVIMGPGCLLRAADHRFDRLDVSIRAQGHSTGTIIVEDDVWLGANVIVLRNVTIGRQSVIGAGSVVTRDIPPRSVAVGNPATVIRTRETGDIDEQPP